MKLWHKLEDERPQIGEHVLVELNEPEGLPRPMISIVWDEDTEPEAFSMKCTEDGDTLTWEWVIGDAHIRRWCRVADLG